MSPTMRTASPSWCRERWLSRRERLLLEAGRSSAGLMEPAATRIFARLRRTTADGPDHDYFAVIDPTLNAWVARGYAVVQTDYEGLGTPGGHPYLNGVSESNTVVDIVRAGRELNGHIGRNWIAMGHSQGAQAALVRRTARQ